jgi:hypothetical protein
LLTHSETVLLVASSMPQNQTLSEPLVTLRCDKTAPNCDALGLYLLLRHGLWFSLLFTFDFTNSGLADDFTLIGWAVRSTDARRHQRGRQK